MPKVYTSLTAQYVKRIVVSNTKVFAHHLVKGHSPHVRRSKSDLTSRRDGIRQQPRRAN